MTAYPYRIIVTGWRHWPADLAWFVEYQLREHFLGEGQMLSMPNVLVHGACPVGDGGVDGIADRYARQLPGITVELHPADFATLGPKAGPIRNTEMVEAGAHVCLAFPGPKERSRGTWDCIRRAVDTGIPTHVWSLAAARRFTR